MKKAVRRVLSVLLAATLIMEDWGGSFVSKAYASEPVAEEISYEEVSDVSDDDIIASEDPEEDNDITEEVYDADAVLETTAESYDFGVAVMGYSAVASKTVTIKNVSGNTVTLEEPENTGDNKDKWVIGNLSKKTLAPNETASFELRPALGWTVSEAGEDALREDIIVKTESGTSLKVKTRFVVGLKGEYTAEEIADSAYSNSDGLFLIGDTTIKISETTDVTIKGIRSMSDTSGKLTFKGSDKGKISMSGPILLKDSSGTTLYDIVLQGGHIITNSGLSTDGDLTVESGFLEVIYTEEGYSPLCCSDLVIKGGKICVDQKIARGFTYVANNLIMTGGIFWFDCIDNGSAPAVRINSSLNLGENALFFARMQKGDGAAVVTKSFSIGNNSVFRAVGNTYSLLVEHIGSFDVGTYSEIVASMGYKRKSVGEIPVGGTNYVECDAIFEAGQTTASKDVSIYPKSRIEKLDVSVKTCLFDSITYGGKRPEKKTVRILNSGDVPLWIKFSEVDNFEVGELSDEFLPAHESAEFTVQPKENLEPDFYSEALMVQANTPNIHEQIALMYTVKPNGSEISVVGDASADFWYAKSGYTELPDPKVFTIKNTGKKDVTFVKPESDDYDVTFKDDKLTLPVGKETKVTICPKKGLEVGNHSAMPFYIRTKEGAYVKLSLYFTVESDQRWNLTVEKELYDFGTAAVGYSTIPDAQTVELKNTGNVKIKINGIADSGRWKLGKLSKNILKPGETATFTISPKASLKANNADLGDKDTIKVAYVTNDVWNFERKADVKARFVVGVEGNMTAQEFDKACPDTGCFYVMGDLKVTLDEGDDVSVAGMTNFNDEPFTFTVTGSDEGILRLNGPLTFKSDHQNMTLESGHVISTSSLCLSTTIGGSTNYSTLTVNGGVLEIDCKEAGKNAVFAYTINHTGGIINALNIASGAPCIYAYNMLETIGGIICAESLGENSPAIKSVNLLVKGNAAVSAYAAGTTGHAVESDNLRIRDNTVFRAEGGEYAVSVSKFFVLDNELPSDTRKREILIPASGTISGDTVVDSESKKAKLVLICEKSIERRSEVAVTPASLSFEYVEGEVPEGKLITVENKGNIFLGLNPLESDKFVAKNYSRHIVLPGETASIEIVPASGIGVGNYNYELAIPTDFTSDKKVNISLSVVPKVYAFTVSPDGDVDLGTAMATAGTADDVDRFSVTTFTITNTGNQYLDFKKGIKLDSTEYFTIQAPEVNTLIGPGKTLTFTVQPKGGYFEGEYSTGLTVKAKEMSKESEVKHISLKAEILTPPEGFWMKEISDKNYTGSEIKPEPRVYKGKYLVSDSEYTVSYKNNVKAASKDAVDKNGKSIAPTVIITGKNDHSGTVSQTFTIKPASIEQAFTDVDPNGDRTKDPEFAHLSLYANENVQKGKFTLKYRLDTKTVTLKNNTDYTLFYPHTDKASTDPENLYDENAFKAPGIYEVKVIGKGNYTGTKTLKLKIVDKESLTLISKVTIPKIPDQPYSGKDFVLEGEDTDSLTRVLDKSGSAYEFVLTDKAKNYTLRSGIDYKLSYSSNREVGKAKVTIIGMGNYTGTVFAYFNIKGTSLSKVKTEGYASSLQYTGDYIKQPMRFYYVTGPKKDPEKNYLLEGIDYIVEYASGHEGYRDVGKYTVKYKGIGAYTGTVTKSMSIVGVNLKNVDVPKDFAGSTFWAAEYDSEKKGFVFRGRDLYVAGEPETYNNCSINLTYKNETLSLGTDYEVSYKNNRNAGKATITFKGIGKFTGSVTRTFKILPYTVTISDNRWRIEYEQDDHPGNYTEWRLIDRGEFAKTKGTTTPNVRIYDLSANRYLDKGKDYTLSYKKNKDVLGVCQDMPRVIIKGKGNYAGHTQRFFVINPADFSHSVVTASDVVYKENTAGLYKKTNVIIKDYNGKALKAGTDYYKKDDKEYPFVYTYAEDWYFIDAETGDRVDVVKDTIIEDDQILEPGTPVCVTVTGKGEYSGTQKGYFRIIKANINDKTVKISIDDQEYAQYDIELENDDIHAKIVKNKKSAPIPINIGEDVIIVPDSYVDNYHKGTAKVTLKGVPEKGYTGTRTVTFKIRARSFDVVEILKKMFLR